MKIKQIVAAGIAAIGLTTASAGVAQMAPQSSPAQATHSLPPTGGMSGGMGHGGDSAGMEASRSGHGQGDAMSMGGHDRMAKHSRCKTVWHHGHKTRRCM